MVNDAYGMKGDARVLALQAEALEHNREQAEQLGHELGRLGTGGEEWCDAVVPAEGPAGRDAGSDEHLGRVLVVRVGEHGEEVAGRLLPHELGRGLDDGCLRLEVVIDRRRRNAQCGRQGANARRFRSCVELTQRLGRDLIAGQGSVTALGDPRHASRPRLPGD